jgi:hypothetical protein
MSFPAVWGPQISRQSAYECGKVSSPKPWPPLTPSKYSWYSFLVQAESPQGRTAAKKIKLMKYPIDTIGGRTSGFPVCSTIPQPTASPQFHFFRVHLILWSHQHLGLPTCPFPSYFSTTETLYVFLLSQKVPHFLPTSFSSIWLL